MSRPIAVFYHCRISGGAHEANSGFEGNPALDAQHALSVVREQAEAFFKSGLMDFAAKFTIGLNGTQDDFRSVRSLFGPVNVVMHGPDASSELPTLALVEAFAKENPNYMVLYTHAKGVSWPPRKFGWELRQSWRRCMMRHTVRNWEHCVVSLVDGYDMAGAHWLTKDKYPRYANVLPRGIWGGNFWWATSEYLSQLAPLCSLEQGMHMGWRFRYQAEHWPTSGRRVPRVRDFADHWPPEPCGHWL